MLDNRSAISASGASTAFMEDFLSSIVRVYWGGVLSPTVLVLATIVLWLGLKSIRTGAKADVSFLFLLILSMSLFVSPRLACSNRYIAYTFPVVVILLSFGAHYIWTLLYEIWGAFKISPAIVTSVYLFAIVLSVQAGFSMRDGKEFCSKQLASFLSDNTSPESVVLVAPSWKRYPLLYYFEGSVPIKGVNTNLDEFGSGLSLEEEIRANFHPVVSDASVANLKNYINGYGDIWYISYEQLPDPKNLVLGWLVENTSLKKIYYVNCSEIRDDPATKMPVFLFQNEKI